MKILALLLVLISILGACSQYSDLESNSETVPEINRTNPYNYPLGHWFTNYSQNYYDTECLPHTASILSAHSHNQYYFIVNFQHTKLCKEQHTVGQIGLTMTLSTNATKHGWVNVIYTGHYHNITFTFQYWDIPKQSIRCTFFSISNANWDVEFQPSSGLSNLDNPLGEFAFSSFINLTPSSCYPNSISIQNSDTIPTHQDETWTYYLILSFAWNNDTSCSENYQNQDYWPTSMIGSNEDSSSFKWIAENHAGSDISGFWYPENNTILVSLPSSNDETVNIMMTATTPKRITYY